MAEEDIQKEDKDEEKESEDSSSENEMKVEEMQDSDKEKESDEKTEEDSDEEKKDEESSDKYSNQLKWVVIVIGVFLGSMFLFAWIGTDSQTYEHVGLNWQKEKFGDLPIHTTYLTGYSVTGKPISFKMNVRNDPRDLDVPIEGELSYIADKPVYFSLDFDSGINDCGTLGLVSFGRFMAEMRFNVITAVTSQNWSEEIDRPVATCEDRPENTVFLLTVGDESKIVQDEANPNCYRLFVNKCEDIEVIERLELATISHYTHQLL
ncbi:hypothetical protein CMI46_00895 [Candidatus Pacearchaeota archaeon]|nr:hypothetical protein [Candidatus Pacearchaeota archaeon]